MSANSSLSSDLLPVGTTVVAVKPARLSGFIALSDGTNLATVTVYDNSTTGSGKVIAKSVSNSSQPTSIVIFENPVRTDNGLTVVVVGSGAGAILYYGV